MKNKTTVETQLYRLNVEPKVIDQLAKLSTRTGEPGEMPVASGK